MERPRITYAPLGLDPAEVEIVRRPPVATFRDRREVGVSLSHHGRFVAFACALGDSAWPKLRRRRGLDLAQSVEVGPGLGSSRARAGP